MIVKSFDKFIGKVKSEILDKEEVIELVSIITDMRPCLPSFSTEENISKLIDNITYYSSEDGKYKIYVYFRESDLYIDEAGSITYGKFKSLYKVTISKVEGEFKLSEIKDYTILTSDIIQNVYPESKMVIKLDDGERMSTNDFRLIEDKTIESIKLIIRII
jgi:hypothetical protein